MDKIRILHKKRIWLLFLCALLGILFVSLHSSEQIVSVIGGIETEEEIEILPATLQGYEGYLNISLYGLSLANTSRLKLYVNGDKAYYFLPACADFKKMTFRFDEERYEVVIDGAVVESGDSIGSYDFACAHDMHITRRLDAQEGQREEGYQEGQQEKEQQEELDYTLTLMQSKNLPAIFIDTLGDIETLHESLENEDRGDFLCVLPDGSIDSQGFLGKMNCRGNASFAKVQKKSYQIKFFTPTDVLGMGTASKFILQANALDHSYLRNKIVYDYCKEIGAPYVTDAVYTDLYLNGEYAGNYLVLERLEFGESRIAVTDGYLIEKMMSGRIQEEDVSFKVEGMDDFIIREPLEVSEEEAAYISEYMNMVERKISACTTWEDYEELGECIDVESFADMYLINAITNDIDSNLASTFYYKLSEAEGGKLYAGPYWDYDNAFGRHDRGYIAELCAYPSGYCEEMFAIPYFRELVVERFNQTAGPVMQRYIDEVVPDTNHYLQASRQMDICRWEAEGHRGDLYSTYEEAYPYLLDYMQKRLDVVGDFLNNYENGTYHRVIFVNTSSVGYRDTEYWVKDGESIPEEIVQEAGDRFYCTKFTDEDGSVYEGGPVCEDIILYGDEYEEL